MVPVIEAACPAALMAGLGRPHRAPPPEPATAGRAVRVPAVTGGTDREEAIALPTGLLTEGLVHGGDARRTTADWTSCPNRGTTRTTGSVCRRARRSRGPGGPSGPSSSLPLRYPKQPGSGHNGGYGRRRPRGRKQPRPPGLAKPRRPRFHTAPTAVIYSGKQEPRTARDPAGASTIVQICALSSERQHEGDGAGKHTRSRRRTWLTGGAYPAEHRRPLRTTNPIASPVATAATDDRGRGLANEGPPDGLPANSSTWVYRTSCRNERFCNPPAPDPLLEPSGHVPPVEFEQQYCLAQEAPGYDGRSQRISPLTNPGRFKMMTRPCIR